MLKKIFFSFLLISFLFPQVILADSFPADSKEVISYNPTGINLFNQLLLENPDNVTFTILHFSSQSKNDLRTTLYCGLAGDIIYNDMLSNVRSFERFSRVKCDDDIYIDIPKETYFTIIYVDYDTLSGGGGTPTIINDFTGGDLVIATFLLILILLKLISFLVNSFGKMNIHKDYQVNTFEGKERHKI